MFVLCVLYSKDKKAKPGQSGQRNRVKKTKQKQKILPGAWIFEMCVLYRKDKRQNAGQSKQSTKCG